MAEPTESPLRIEGARRSRVRELLRDERGAAMTEAVIMMPVLILVWASIIYIHYSFRDAQRNMATLRNDAWSHALNGCQTSASAPTVFDDGGSYDGEAGGGIGGLGSVMRWITNNVFMLDEFGARRETTVARPRHLGGGERSLRWDLLMLCNEDQRGDDDTPWYEALFDFFSGA